MATKSMIAIVVENPSCEGLCGCDRRDWYRFLARRPDLTEVNFWRPGGGRAFHVLAVGEPFLFKTHAPHNRVGGGGFYSGFACLTPSEAWKFYGHANGAETLAQMRRRIESRGDRGLRRART